MEFSNKKEFFSSSPSRRRESYIKSNFPEIYDELQSDSYKDFETFSDKMNRYVFGGGYCVVCNTRTKKETGASGFRKTCSVKCGGIIKQGQEAHNKSDIDEEIVKTMYVEELKSPQEIGNHFNVSNVTINKIIEKLGIKRSHSEQQKLHSLKGRTPWNYSGIKEFNFIEEKPQSAREVQKLFNVDLNIVYLYALKQEYKFSSKSYIEDIISDILKELNIEFTQNRKNVIFPLEVDFYIPKFNMCIETNGLYHHCHLNKDNQYHYNKYVMCKEKDLQLIQFWEDDIRDKREIIKSYLKSKFGLNEIIYARKCKIVEIKSKDAMSFYNKYHLQGSTKNGKHYGLIYNDELVSCMSFSKKNENVYELTRFCTKSNITVVGAFSKLIKKYSNYDIVSYSNNDYSDGSVYLKNGFECISENKSSMMYTDLNVRYSREQFMKSKLKEMFPESYDDNKTEREILEINKIYQCVGSGTIKWYKKSTQ